MNDWTFAFDQPKVGTDIIYTDFRKAFDSVAHKRLLLKLKCYGIGGKMLLWLENFLTGRRQRVVLNGSFSRWSEVVSGVPQGSVLGPMLFLFFVNELPNTVNVKIKLFANDCKLYTSVASTEDCIEN